jgi:hypothetical protein
MSSGDGGDCHISLKEADLTSGVKSIPTAAGNRRSPTDWLKAATPKSQAF